MIGPRVSGVVTSGVPDHPTLGSGGHEDATPRGEHKPTGVPMDGRSHDRPTGFECGDFNFAPYISFSKLLPMTYVLPFLRVLLRRLRMPHEFVRKNYLIFNSFDSC